MKTIVLVLAALVAAPLTAAAQNLGALDDHANLATMTTGHEYGLAVGAGYARVVPVASRPLVVGGDVTFGAAAIDLGDFRLRAGALAPAIAHDRWKLVGSLAAIVRGTDNDLGRLVDLGADAAILGGWYARRGFAAVELGADLALATHVHHGEAYRMSFPDPSDARDRWLGAAGVVPRAGVQGGVSVGRVDVILRLGRLGGGTMFPIYGTLAVTARF